MSTLYLLDLWFSENNYYALLFPLAVCDPNSALPVDSYVVQRSMLGRLLRLLPLSLLWQFR